MLSEKFGLIALFYGAVTATVLIASGVARFRRGKIVSAQLFVSLTLVLTWVASNVAFVMLDAPTSNDLAFPYFDIIGMAALMLVAAIYREDSLWMRYIWLSSLGQMIFHVPYLASSGTIMPKYYYHLTLNMIFLSQHIALAAGLYIRRSKWMEWDRKLTEIIEMKYKEIFSLVHFSGKVFSK